MSTEVITVAEALRRVGLEELIEGSHERQHLGWTGYPKPFACGHVKEMGFGPLVSGDGRYLSEAEAKEHPGARRLYTHRVRVNQHYCSGQVLFYWGRFLPYSNPRRAGEFFAAQGGFAVVLDVPPGEREPVLKVVESV